MKPVSQSGRIFFIRPSDGAIKLACFLLLVVTIIYLLFILYQRASLVAQLVKNLPVMWETWVRSLAWEDPLEEGKATHFSILTWQIPWTV